MSILFTPQTLGRIRLPNRLVRSATAECLADATGRPLPRLQTLYRELAEGGVGLIITGHMYVHPSGKAHPEMAGIYADTLLPGLRELAAEVHRAGGLAAVQINHGGRQCSQHTVPEPVGPSAVELPFQECTPRELTGDEIEMLVEAYGHAARRVQEAGFDAVQIHAAHGYLISQFLSPLTNRRTDRWGGDLTGRMQFLRSVCDAVRQQVGPDFPVLAKLGMVDRPEGGLTPAEAMEVVAALEEMGLDGVEISGGSGGGTDLNTRKGIRSREDEAYFRPLARQARQATRLPILLVGGLRSREVMEEVLTAGDADFVSMCRPLISEPDLPRRLRQGIQDQSRCLSTNQCWPEEVGEGIACHCLEAPRRRKDG